MRAEKAELLSEQSTADQRFAEETEKLLSAVTSVTAERDELKVKLQEHVDKVRVLSVSVRNVGQPDNTGISVNCPFTTVEAFVGRGKLRGHVVRGLRDGLSSSVTGVELSRAAASPHQEKPAEAVQASDKDVTSAGLSPTARKPSVYPGPAAMVPSLDWPDLTCVTLHKLEGEVWLVCLDCCLSNLTLMSMKKTVFRFMRPSADVFICSDMNCVVLELCDFYV